jgi:hypothetical protein
MSFLIIRIIQNVGSQSARCVVKKSCAILILIRAEAKVLLIDRHFKKCFEAEYVGLVANWGVKASDLRMPNQCDNEISMFAVAIHVFILKFSRLALLPSCHETQ